MPDIKEHLFNDTAVKKIKLNFASHDSRGVISGQEWLELAPSKW